LKDTIQKNSYKKVNWHYNLELPDKYQELMPEVNLFSLNYNDTNSSSYADAEIIMDKM
jgi:hypothetical protein